MTHTQIVLLLHRNGQTFQTVEAGLGMPTGALADWHSGRGGPEQRFRDAFLSMVARLVRLERQAERRAGK